MVSDAQHKEAKHHPEAAKHTEAEHNALIHHANGAPKVKHDVKVSTVHEKHSGTAPPHDHHAASKISELHDKKPSTEKVHAKLHPEPKPHSEPKPHFEAKQHAEAKRDLKADSSAEIKHLEALRNKLQPKFAKEGETLIVQEKAHIAGKPVTLETKAAAPPAAKVVEEHSPASAPKVTDVRQHATAPVDNSTFHAVSSYLASTAVGKAFESWSSTLSGSLAEAKSPTPEVAPEHKAPKSKAALELEALQRGDCGGARTPIIENWITRNEVAKHTYTAYTPNDNNTGIAVGELQWNQKKGSLPDLMRAWHHQDAAKFDQIFGKYSKDLLSNQYVKKADFNGVPELLNGMHTALADKEFQGVQDNLRTKQIYHYCEVAHSFGFNSIRGEGYVADAANQLGIGHVERILEEDFDSLKYSQSKRIDMFKVKTDVDRQNGATRNQRVSRGSQAVYTVVANLKKQVQIADAENSGK